MNELALATAKVKVGFFSFTEITDPAEHRSYNEWHLFDHMPEQFPIPGIAYGQRWVSTPARRAARAVSGARLDATHYLTCYLMTEPVTETLGEFMRLGRALAAAGRFHQHRRALLSGPFVVEGGEAASRVLVRPEALPYRPHRGIYVVVEDASAGGDAADHRRALLDVPRVAGVWSFGPGDRSLTDAWPPSEHRITVAWIDGAPDAGVTHIDAIERDRADATGVIFAGALETISPWQWDWFDPA